MGPLKGVKIIEVGGIGPGPFGAMMLADMGADIIRVDRKVPPMEVFNPKYDVMSRSRRSIIVDLKRPEGIEVVLKLTAQSDGLIEGFRPGVMERLGLGPDVCMKRNPRLVYGRITGWGQEGPLAQAAGHDINYISLVGALDNIGSRGGKPVPPLNLLGDYGGGGMLLAFGMVCGLYEAQKSGKGQVVDAAMIDGVAALITMIYGFKAAGQWKNERGTHMVGSGAHFYDAYETADGKYVSVGSIEPQFYALLLKHTGITDPEFKYQMDSARWPKFKEKIITIFKTKTRDEWCKIMEGTDVCFAPVLTVEEAMEHPHNVARKTFVDFHGIKQAAPAPRFSRTKAEIQGPPASPGEHTVKALLDWGFPSEEIESLKKAGVVELRQPK